MLLFILRIKQINNEEKSARVAPTIPSVRGASVRGAAPRSSESAAAAQRHWYAFHCTINTAKTDVVLG